MSNLEVHHKQFRSHAGYDSEENLITLWNSSTGAVGYNIYRGAVSGGPYSMINTSLVTSAAYSDNTVASGQTYYYVATAVDGSSNESAYSNQTQAVIPNP
jgi:fibronectin type 3 domain-containing protein